MTISILGAGWLGLPLGEALVQAGHEVKASTTSADKLSVLEEAGLQPYWLRLEERGWVDDPLDFFKCDALVITLPPGGRRDAAVETRYPHQMEVIVAAAERAGCRQVLFTSSTGVYGEQEGWVDERAALSPTSASGRALVKVEQMLQDWTAGKVTILRLAGLAGEGRHPGRWFAGKTDLAGGQQYVNLVHLADVIGVCKAVLEQGKWGHVFNVCADEHPTKADFYPQATRDWGGAIPTFLADDPGSKGKRIENQLGKRELGYGYQYPSPFDFSY